VYIDTRMYVHIHRYKHVCVRGSMRVYMMSQWAATERVSSYTVSIFVRVCVCVCVCVHAVGCD